jgi:selenide,water dikinase
VGFTVNGLVDTGAARGKGGLRPRDRLVLTKALGTGALFAADMRHRAKGRWIEGALASMRQSSRAAAACLVEHGARAMTDVTGFGLLGHLSEMLAASAVHATLKLESLPALEGAREVLQEGFRSSLQAANARLQREIANPGESRSHPSFGLLLDPQTAGGLLAGVPGDTLDECINGLRACGYPRADVVGEVREQEEDAARVRLLF